MCIRDRTSVIGHFFETYKDLEPDKDVHSSRWFGRAVAERVIIEAIDRAKRAGHSTARWKGPEIAGH